MDIKNKPINQLMLELAYMKREIDLLMMQYTSIRTEIVNQYPQLESELESFEIYQKDLKPEKRIWYNINVLEKSTNLCTYYLAYIRVQEIYLIFFMKQ